MHILFWAAFYTPFPGGYANSLHGLAKRLVERGHRVTVITAKLQGWSSEETIDGVRVLRFECWNPKALNESFPIPKWGALKRVVHKIHEPVDIVSTQTRFFPSSFWGWWYAKRRKLPVVHVERGARHTVAAPLTTFIGKILDHTQGWLLARFSTKVVGVSGAAMEFLKHLGARDAITIFNGVDVDYWSENTTSRSDITFVGRVVEAKGAQDLITALAQIQESRPHLLENRNLNIVGEGSFLETLQHIAHELNMTDKVVFHGELNTEKVRDVLYRTTIFVNPSYSEGLPRCVLEAGAAGCAVIATDVGGTRDILVNKRVGRLVSPRAVGGIQEALVELLSDDKERKEIAAHLQTHIEKNFSWTMVTDQYETLFKSIINSKSE